MPTGALIKSIQRTHYLLSYTKERAKLSSDNISEMKKDLSLMKQCVQERLKHMRKIDLGYFPVGSFVEYGKTSPPVNAEVLHEDEKFIYIRCEGEVDPIKVSRSHLKLKYIR